MKYKCTAPCGQRPCQTDTPGHEYKGHKNQCPLEFAHEWVENEKEKAKETAP